MKFLNRKSVFLAKNPGLLLLWNPIFGRKWYLVTEPFLVEHNCFGLKLFDFLEFSRLKWFLGFCWIWTKSLLLRFALSNSKSSNISFKWVERNRRPSRNHFSSLFFDQFSHFWQLTIIFSVKIWLKPKSPKNYLNSKTDDLEENLLKTSYFDSKSTISYLRMTIFGQKLIIWS